jgi:methyl-accepting chemotaxis protein
MAALALYLVVHATDTTYKMREQELANLTESVTTLLADLDARQLAGELTLQEAQASALKLITRSRFGDAGYYYAYDLQGVTLAHPIKTDWVGQNKIDLQDANGVQIIREMIDVVQSSAGHGPVRYHFQKPDSDALQMKIGYARIFEPWGWVVGTGAYVEDIKADVSILRNATWLGMIVAATIMALLSYSLTRSIMRPLERRRARIAALANKDTAQEVTDTDNRSELGEMARGVEVLRQAMQRSDELELRDQQRQQERARVVAVLNEKLSALADGDLTCKIETPFPGEFEDTRQDFNAAVERITTLIRVLLDGISEISSESASLEASSQELSRRTETQAASLEETTAALNLLSETLRETEGETTLAAQRTEQSKSMSDDGRDIVAKTIDAMATIEKSSKEIMSFVALIDDIAFQTNLLALNAGVEAARAGKSGRGFTVVAEEVRGLAVRASQAAKDINSLVSGANLQVEQGAQLAQSSGNALMQIGENVGEVQQMIQRVAEATSDQARGLGEVTTAANQLDEVTQRNAAMFEETSATTLRLRESVQELRQAAGQFHLPQAQHWQDDNDLYQEAS